jgi:hypothetical protein
MEDPYYNAADDVFLKAKDYQEAMQNVVLTLAYYEIALTECLLAINKESENIDVEDALHIPNLEPFKNSSDINVRLLAELIDRFWETDCTIARRNGIQ